MSNKCVSPDCWRIIFANPEDNCVEWKLFVVLFLPLFLPGWREMVGCFLRRALASPAGRQETKQKINVVHWNCWKFGCERDRRETLTKSRRNGIDWKMSVLSFGQMLFIGVVGSWSRTRSERTFAKSRRNGDCCFSLSLPTQKTIVLNGKYLQFFPLPPQQKKRLVVFFGRALASPGRPGDETEDKCCSLELLEVRL